MKPEKPLPCAITEERVREISKEEAQKVLLEYTERFRKAIKAYPPDFTRSV